MALADEIPAWRFAFETVCHLFDREFDRDARHTRQYVLEHRPEVDGGQTLSQLLFARRRAAVEKHTNFLDALRPPRPPLTDEEMEARYGYEGPRYEMIDGVLCIMPRREKK